LSDPTQEPKNIANHTLQNKFDLAFDDSFTSKNNLSEQPSITHVQIHREEVALSES
jgi:hypothetical protein